MDWSTRTVSDTLTVERYSVSDIITEYAKNSFYVNRRYQRKLVWGIEEKRLLIDSLLKGIPLPAILLVKYDVEGGQQGVLEIVDGMQRLDAIISYLLGQFWVEYDKKKCYFDPKTNNETFQLLMNGDSRLKNRDCFLPTDACLKLCRCQLPVIITGQDDATVDMIFSRINSTGRKISSQDLRQSFATGDFSDLVRRVASNIRLDHTYTDHICLCDMPKISVGYNHQGYGVDLNAIFWRRHDLIDAIRLRESKDEELIETMLAMALLKDFKKSKDNLDNLYKKGTKLNSVIEQAVAKRGKEKLELHFRRCFDMIDMVFDSVQSDFSSFLFTNKRVSNKDVCFSVLFLAVHRLLEDGYTVLDYKKVADGIKRVSKIICSFSEKNAVDYNEIGNSIQILYDSLKRVFSKEVVSHSTELQDILDRRLNYSKIEMQMTEYKIGIIDFESGKVNLDCVHQIARTLVAMANTRNRDEIGYVLVGIADNRESYQNWYDVYSEQAAIINQHYVPGITSEARRAYGGSDIYLRNFRQMLSREPISQKLKECILENILIFDYHGVELLVVPAKNVGEISLYDEKKYVRQGTETILV